MLFNSLEFLIFFPVVVILFFALPHRWRWLLLLIASYYFYMAWEPAYGLLILFSTFVDYLAALGMGATTSIRKRRWLLVFSLASNLGLLFFFKYFGFFFEFVTPLIELMKADFSSPTLSLLLPVGISFYTFQSLSYTIDVYRGTRRPERHFGIFALYVSFFPQLVAGPIESSTRLLPQFYKKIAPDASRFIAGLRLMLWGFFKKVVIADNAARIVDSIYGSSNDMNGIALMIGTFFFAIQIYCDFSGYSDIARGSARILGYDLILNFNRPYFARSIGEFWRRWHISLMEWFKHYIYIPIGGSHGSNALWVRNIAIVFLVSGIWHGANWTFVVWGLLNVSYIIIGRYTKRERDYIAYSLGISILPRIRAALAILNTFGLTCLAWIFFRAQSLSEAVNILKRMALDAKHVLIQPTDGLAYLTDAGTAMKITKPDLLVLIAAISILFVTEVYLERNPKPLLFYRLPRPARWTLYYGLIMLIILGGYFGESAFLYFQF